MTKFLGYLVPSILGLFIAGYGIFSAVDNFLFFLKAHPATAEIKNVEKIAAGGRGALWYLEIEFLNEKNEKVSARIVPESGGGYFGYQKGEKINIYYINGKYSDARLKEFESVYLKAGVFFLIGLGLLILGIKRFMNS